MNEQHCRDIARKQDRDRYYCALFAPVKKRHALFVLIAFNSEISRIADVVSEPMLGEIRLQWWRESIAGIYDGKIRKHPVVEALADVIDIYDLKSAAFIAMIDARADELYDDGPMDIAAVTGYCQTTSGALAVLGADILDPSGQKRGMARDVVRDAARAAGTALGLAGIARAMDEDDRSVPELTAAGRAQISLARQDHTNAQGIKGILLQVTLADDIFTRLDKGLPCTQTPLDDLKLLVRLAWYSLRHKY